MYLFVFKKNFSWILAVLTGTSAAFDSTASKRWTTGAHELMCLHWLWLYFNVDCEENCFKLNDWFFIHSFTAEQWKLSVEHKEEGEQIPLALILSLLAQFLTADFKSLRNDVTLTWSWQGKKALFMLMVSFKVVWILGPGSNANMLIWEG